MTSLEMHRRLEALADLGLTVSICYGPCGEHGRLYSVQCLSPDHQSFADPFGARTIEQAIEIAEIEGARLRGW